MWVTSAPGASPDTASMTHGIKTTDPDAKQPVESEPWLVHIVCVDMLLCLVTSELTAGTATEMHFPNTQTQSIPLHTPFFPSYYRATSLGDMM